MTSPSPVTDLRWLRPYASDAAAYDVCVLHPVRRAVERPGEDAFSFGCMWTEAARAPRLRDAALAAWIPHQAGATALPVNGAYFAVWELDPRDVTSPRPLSARRYGSRVLPWDPDRAVVYAGGHFHQLHRRTLDHIHMVEDE
ncbi:MULTISPECIES: hypothetical protein [Streptomyces]|uniref:hypothetical protein n=1 Tax=Streptomyces TaxID=1883 RepID=UPI000BEF4D92|nr:MULTISPECIES: hypothetical protein [unclassified Streptomyces]WTE25167.1 hypothetical protein OHB50_05895 [Streptomyces anulatus]